MGQDMTTLPQLQEPTRPRLPRGGLRLRFARERRDIVLKIY